MKKILYLLCCGALVAAIACSKNSPTTEEYPIPEADRARVAALGFKTNGMQKVPLPGVRRHPPHP